MAKTILVVDDSPTIRQQLRVFLKNNHFHVIEAENGEVGLAAARTNPVDLMIVDINMPVMDGITMITEVRKLPNHGKTPIFVLTTQASRVTSAKGRAAGATAWIIKPFKPEILLEGIKKILGV